MKKVVAYALLIVFALSFRCVEAEVPVECMHQWRAFQQNEDHELLMQTWTFAETDDRYHIKRYYVPDEVCDLCGALSSEGDMKGSQEPHAFIVKNSTKDESNMEIGVLYECRDCGYEKSLTLTRTAILNDSADDCLLGGQCAADYHAYMNAAGELVWGSAGSMDYQAFVGVVQTDECYLLLSREYCIRCGRPRAVLLEKSSGAPDERWKNVEIMTMDEFLSEEMAANLPFRLVDDLRHGGT